jgi:hypothetical protein
VINAKLEDAIAIGPHLIHVHQAGGHERSSGEANQTDTENGPAVQFRRVDFHTYLSVANPESATRSNGPEPVPTEQLLVALSVQEVSAR